MFATTAEVAELGLSTLPRTQRFDFDEPEEGQVLEFRLIYSGRLPAESSKPRVEDKHRIRKCFHKQLAELWKHNRELARQRTVYVHKRTNPTNAVVDPGKEVIQVADELNPGGRPWVEYVADDYARFGYRFVPLVRKENGFSCSIEVLFLRRESPGDVYWGGDIDNRIKVLFDSLKMPETRTEANDELPGADEDPFFCLLADDRLITSLNVTTDRLLVPSDDPKSKSDVHLVIDVKITDPGALFSPSGLV